LAQKIISAQNFGVTGQCKFEMNDTFAKMGHCRRGGGCQKAADGLLLMANGGKGALMMMMVVVFSYSFIWMAWLKASSSF
jgi:hypothetical protein